MWLQSQKYVYIDKLNDIVNKYNNANHSTIKMKVADVNSSKFVDFDIENNDNDPKFQFDDYVRVSK